jgi:hypothetical protein
MPCPDCEQLYTELEALKAELKAEFAAACGAFVKQQERLLDQMDRVLKHRHQVLVALVDRHLHDSLARLAQLEAALRLPRREPPSEPPARH